METGQRRELEPLPTFSGGFAAAVNLRLRALSVPSAVSRALAHLKSETSDKAHIHRLRHREDPGLWCDFALNEWASAIPMDKANLRVVLDWLVTHHVIWMDVERGRGRIGWNTAIEEWEGATTHGGRRPGAGAPKGNQNARKQVNDATENNQIHYGETIKSTTANQSNSLRKQSNSLRETIKYTTATPEKPGNDAASEGVLDTYGIRSPSEERIHTSSSSPSDASGVAPSKQEKPAKPKAEKPVFAPESEPYLLAIHWRRSLASYAPDYPHLPRSEAQMQHAAGVFEALLRIDKAQPARVHQVIDWVAQDEFNRPNVLSPEKLRKRWTELELKARPKKAAPLQQRNEPPSIIPAAHNPFRAARNQGGSQPSSP